MRIRVLLLSLLLAPLLLATTGCQDNGGNGGDASVDIPRDAPDADISRDAPDANIPPSTFTIMTFNVGTTEWMPHEDDPDGYSSELASLQSSFFGNNLAWMPAAEGVRRLIDQYRPDVVAFQELYFDGDCATDCPKLLQKDPDQYAVACDSDAFPCQGWTPTGDITVRRVLGPDYAIACAPGHPDNCVGVRHDFGTLAGCTDGPCLDGLDGMPPPNGCTKGARVATAVVQVHEGPELTVVDVHTTAGTNIECRKAQFQQVFEDRGDGKPAAFGVDNLVLGDMNIDPFDASQAKYDASARYWNDQVGDDKPFRYLSSSGASGPYTHPFTMTRLDHVISDTLAGSCVVLGVSEGTTAPLSTDSTFFDHRPVFCTVGLPTGRTR